MVRLRPFSRRARSPSTSHRTLGAASPGAGSGARRTTPIRRMPGVRTWRTAKASNSTKTAGTIQPAGRPPTVR
jgi:hypothetical protein